MSKQTLLKKRSNIHPLKSHQYRQLHFTKNSIIIRKNESFRHVYMLKSGQAGIFSQNDPNQLLHKYKQGQYLNSVQICMSQSSFKTVKAISTRCDILLMAWSKERHDQEKRNKFIKKIQEIKFYEISLFKNLEYALMLELAINFNKIILTKQQINQFLKNSLESTCFIVEGALVLETQAKKIQQEPLRRSISCKTKQQHNSKLQQKPLKLIKFQKGQLLFHDKEHKFQYICQAQKCQIIYINTHFLDYLLPSQYVKKFKKLKQSQEENLKCRKSKSYKALKSLSKSINRLNSKSTIVPTKFQNQIQTKCQKFQKARSVHYIKNNPRFQSYSDQKRKILEERDKGYKQISQLNRRKYGRNYIYQKRLQISRNIHGENFGKVQGGDNIDIKNSQDQTAMRRGVTVYESVTMKDDYGIMKQSPFMKFIKRNRSKKKNYNSLHSSPYKTGKNEQQIQNLTLKSVEKIRKNFQDKSKTLLKNYQKQQHESQVGEF